MPRSPKPKILDPSVTTMTETFRFQLNIIELKSPLSSREKYIPLARRNNFEYSRHASPTVGV